MLKNIHVRMLRTGIFAVLLSVTGLSATFDAAGARAAINSFTQALSAASISGVEAALAAFDAQLASANQSAYKTNTDLAAALTGAQTDLASIRSTLTSPPTTADVNALEAAYTSYVGGIECLRLQDVLSAAQADSAQALSDATAVVQQLLDAFNVAKDFVIDSTQSSQPIVS